MPAPLFAGAVLNPCNPRDSFQDSSWYYSPTNHCTNTTICEADLSGEMGQTASQGRNLWSSTAATPNSHGMDWLVGAWGMSSIQSRMDHCIFSSNHSVTITELLTLGKVLGSTLNLLHEEMSWHAIGVARCNPTSRNQCNAAGRAEIQNRHTAHCKKDAKNNT